MNLKFFLFLFLMLFCLNKVNAQISQADLEAAVKSGVDPYFVESSDTISTCGPDCITRDVLQDKKGNYWFATWHGIIGYDGKYFTNYTLKCGLIHFHVLSIFEDKKGNIWFGTARGGVYRFNPSASLHISSKSFKLFTTKDGLTDNTIISMAEDKTGNIWFGTENGVSRYDPSHGKNFTSYTTRDGLAGNYINSIIVDKNGKVWIGGDGITCFDGKSFSIFTNPKSTKRITGLYEDKSGNIWIGAFDGLTRYDGKSFSKYLSDYLTYYFTEDKKGDMWFSHSEPNTHYPDLPNQVLYRYDGNSVEKIVEKDEPNDFQLFGKIADKNGNVWFGTMHGPCMYDGKTVTRFTK